MIERSFTARRELRESLASLVARYPSLASNDSQERGSEFLCNLTLHNESQRVTVTLMARPKVTDRAIADETLTIRITSPERRALDELCARRAAELEGTGAVITAAGLVRALIVREAKSVLGGIPAQAPAKPAPTHDEIRAMVLDTIKAIDTARPDLRHLVTLPFIKDALPGIPSDAVNEALKSLEEDRTIDLKIQNDPTKAEHPEQGFRVADRGLIYFAVLPDARQRTIFDVVDAEKSAPTPSPQATDSAAKPARRAKPTAPKLSFVGRLKLVQEKELKSFRQIGIELGMKDGSAVGKWVEGTRNIPANYETQLDAILTRLGV